jgi:hypothetical protein
MLGSALCRAQALKEYTRYKEKYPLADVVCTSYACSIEITLKKHQPHITYSTSEEYFYLGTNNGGYSKRTFYYSDFYKLKKYAAWSMHESNDMYKKQVVKDFKKNDFVNNNIFQDDARELVFRFPNLNKGDKSFKSCSYEITDPHFLPTFSLSPYLDYEQVNFSITVSKDIALIIDTFNWSQSKLNFQTKQKGSSIIYSWTGSNPKWLSHQGNGPDFDCLAAQLLFRIAHFTDAGRQTSVQNNLDDLFKWYYNFLDKDKDAISNLKHVADSITGTETDTLKMAELLYKWTQNNIRYIAFENGYEGLIPAKASVVYKERYGDCKGMANLLYSLMRSKGLDAHLCWIGTRALPFKYSVLPSPHVDDHMIAAMRWRGKWIFMDATGSTVPFGLPSPFIQGKEALIELGAEDRYEIAQVPETDAGRNKIYDSCFVRLNQNEMKGSGLAILTGYHHMAFIDRIENQSYYAISKYCRDLLLKGNNRFVLDTVWLENLNDPNQPLNIHYTFTLLDQALWVDGECYINLNLDKLGLPRRPEGNRNVAVEYRFKSSEENVVCLEIPPGLKVEALPQSAEIDNDRLHFRNSYRQQGSLLIRNQSLSKGYLLLEPVSFPLFNRTIDAILKNYNQQITLKK